MSPLLEFGVAALASNNKLLHHVLLFRNLTHVGLKGPIPAALGKLTSLRVLDLGNDKNCKVACGPWNGVTGDLAALATLANLESL